MLLHCVVLGLGSLALYWTNLMSPSMFYGGVLPICDMLFLAYLATMVTKFFAKRGSNTPLLVDAGVENVMLMSNNGECGSHGSDTHCADSSN
jgi:hypothetical protein